MQMNRKEFAAGMASLMVVGCSAESKNKTELQMPVKVKKDKILFVYFSRSGNTRYATETFAKACGGATILPPKAFYGSTIKMGIGLKVFIADRLAVEA